MKDFLVFRRMLTPILLQALFWLGIVFCLMIGVYDFFKHLWDIGFTVLIFGPIAVRILCEFLLLFFRINETLTEIKNEIVATHKLI